MKASFVVLAMLCIFSAGLTCASGEDAMDSTLNTGPVSPMQAGPVSASPIGGQTGFFSITSVPNGADVIFDGSYEGETPVVIEVDSTGSPSHMLSISRYGYQTWTRTYSENPEPGQTIYVTARLEPFVQTGSVQVSSSPSGAIARLDGGQTLQTPGTFTAVPSGRHTIEVSRSGYFPYSTVVTVPAGGTSSVNAALSPIQSTGSLRVSSSPSGAEVYVDEIYRGYTPLTVGSLSTGRHTVRLQLSGYQDSTRTVDISPGSEAAISVVMNPAYQPSYGDILVSSVPDGAAIYLDSVYRGITLQGNSFDISAVAPGTHTISLLKSGYQDYSTTVSVAAGSVSTVSAVLNPGSRPPATGSITAQSSPSGADVYLDNAYRGFTPLTISDISAGSHVVMFRMAGYTDAQYPVQVVSGQSMQVLGMLSPSPTTPPTRSPLPPIGAAFALAALAIGLSIRKR